MLECLKRGSNGVQSFEFGTSWEGHLNLDTCKNDSRVVI